ncbi:hypothetical protein [Flexithrix dorotheae]|uniref:hypothetical protein n=1 Tax=Flexithrix dorotheae TaxID=70993 RepID=UPI00036BB655|nr:hypothetical protein [Flexithrix dorotheae]
MNRRYISALINYRTKNQNTGNPPPPPPGTANGNLFSVEDLEKWKYRMENGIYMNWGDQGANSPGEGQQTIVNNANLFISQKPDVYPGPLKSDKNGGEGNPNWNGDNYSNIIPFANDAHLDYGSTLHNGGGAYSMEYLIAAAFYARVFNDENLGRMVINRLVEQAENPYIDFKRSPRWDKDPNDADALKWHKNPFFLISEWLTGRAKSWDFVRVWATATEKTKVETWLRNGALKFKEYTDQAFLYKVFDSENDRNNGNFNTEKLKKYADPNGEKTHDDNPVANYAGYKLTRLTGDYNNRPLALSGLSSAVIGAILNDEQLLQHGFNMFREMIQFGVFADGTVGDIKRGWPTGLTYSGAILNNMSFMAHAVWKAKGDASWFNYQTSEGITGKNGATSTTGGPKSLEKMLETHSKYYRTINHGFNPKRTFGGKPLDGSYSGGTTTWHHMISVSVANEYYKRQDFKDFYMMKTSAGYTGFLPKSKINRSGYQYPMQGVYGNEPNVPLQYWDLP